MENKGDTNMPDYKATDRSGHTVVIHQLSDDRMVFISQDGWREKREIVSIKGGLKI